VLYQIELRPWAPSIVEIPSSEVAQPGQRRVQGTLFAFLTLFFAGITAAAFDAGVWVVVVAGAALTFWMGSLALRTLRAARQS
jgi:hypothetical protein